MAWRTPLPRRRLPKTPFTVAVPGRWSEPDSHHGALPNRARSPTSSRCGASRRAVTCCMCPCFSWRAGWWPTASCFRRPAVRARSPARAPQVRSHDIPLTLNGSDLDLRIDLSTFQHRDNGMENPPLLGLARPMERWIALEWARASCSSPRCFCCSATVWWSSCSGPGSGPRSISGSACLLLLPFGARARTTTCRARRRRVSASTACWPASTSPARGRVSCLAYVRDLYPRETPAWPYWILQGR